MNNEKKKDRESGEITTAQLAGSERQIKWAEKIRAGKIAEMHERIAETTESQAEWLAACQPSLAMGGIGFMDDSLRRAETALELMLQIESAVFWIDYRDWSVRARLTVGNEISDLAQVCEKFITDAEKPLAKLSANDTLALERYFGLKYADWFAKRGFSAKVFAPKAPEFEIVRDHFENKFKCGGNCNQGSDVCACKFYWACSKCGAVVRTLGEDMPMAIQLGGVCRTCESGEAAA